MFKQLKQKLLSFLSNDIGIDLGTANTLVYVRGKGIIINEPSVVAVNQKTQRVVAIGHKARQMVGRTPAHIVAVRPLVDGVISDFEVTEEMLAHLIKRAQQEGPHKLLGPRVVIGVPSGTTNVEQRAVRDAARNAGAREVHVIEEPMAAALGTRLPISEAVGSMIIDIGGGTADIAIISLDGIVTAKNVKLAGDRLNRDIVSHIRDEFHLLIGEKTAEDLKVRLGSVVPLTESMHMPVRGRDLITGLPREIAITDGDVREAISTSIDSFVEAVKEVLEETPPEVVSDVMRRGVHLVGGGALIRGLDTFLSDWLKVPVYIAEEPLLSVARGTGAVLEDVEAHQHLTVEDEHELPPTV